MISPALERFISHAIQHERELTDPADCVLALAPVMLELIDEAGTFLATLATWSTGRRTAVCPCTL